MIYTFTYSPSIDYIVHVDHLKPGTLNVCSSASFYYGGKGINVSQVLHNLGCDNVALGFVAGFTGDEIERGLSRMHIQTDFIHLAEGISRINVKIPADMETEINGPAAIPSEKELEALFDRISQMKREDMLILAGRMSPGIRGDFYAKLYESLPYSDMRVVADTTGEMLRNVLPYHPYLVKPNHHELGELFQVEIREDDLHTIEEYARQMQTMGARNVLVSLGASGAFLVTEDGQAMYREAPEGRVINSVGAGDSMLAGFVATITEGGSYPDALDMAVCAGSATAFRDGLASKDEIISLQNR